MAPVPAEPGLAVVGTMQVELVYCAGPHQLQQTDLRLPPGSTVADALAASGFGFESQPPASAPAAAGLRVGVWGKAREPGHLLREGDRVEVYRSLLVDPKEARRLRYAQHKAKLASMGPPRIANKKTD
jgi:uncharacterized protein